MPHDALHLNLSKDNLLAFFPLPGDKHYRIVGNLPEGTEKDEGELLYEEIERSIKNELKKPLDVHDVNWFSTYKVHTDVLKRFRRPLLPRRGFGPRPLARGRGG